MGLALLAPTSALAAEETSKYNQTPTTPTTTTPTTPTTPTPGTTTPTTGTSPESAEKAPAETTPAKSPEPTSSSSPAKEAKTLPFTGFDLRWSFAIGLALMIAGFSIVGVQRRRNSER
jgi:LPXTG-motif cell wall-anchored protein